MTRVFDLNASHLGKTVTVRDYNGREHSGELVAIEIHRLPVRTVLRLSVHEHPWDEAFVHPDTPIAVSA